MGRIALARRFKLWIPDCAVGRLSIGDCRHGPFLELFARGTRPGWSYWGNQADESYKTTWETYAHNSHSEKSALKSSKRSKQTDRAFDLFPAE